MSLDSPRWLARIPGWLPVLVLGGVLFFPLLGSYGFWDPVELEQADRAREMLETGSFARITLDEHGAIRSPLTGWLIAAGFALLGPNEFAARFPLALVGLLGLLALYRAGDRLASRATGLVAALILATTPTYLFQARQLVTDIPFYVAIVLSIGGYASYLWPVDGHRRRLDLVLGAGGLVMGCLARGLILGASLPILAIIVTLLLTRRMATSPSPAHHEDRSCEATQNRDGNTEAGASPALGHAGNQATRGTWLPLLVSLLSAAAAIVLVFLWVENAPVLLFGGSPHAPAATRTFDLPAREIAYSFFPWVAILPLALLALMATPSGRATAHSITIPLWRSPVRTLAVVTALLGYLFTMAAHALVGPIRFPTLPWLAFACALFLAANWQMGRRRGLWGLAAAAIVVIVHQDFFMSPDSFAFSHLLGDTAYPEELSIKLEMRLFGLALFAPLFYFGLAGVPRPIQATRSGGWISAVANALAHAINFVGEGVRTLAGPRERHLWIVAVAIVLPFAGWSAWHLTPELSLHMSNKAIFETYRRCSRRGEVLTQYGVTGGAASYYGDQPAERLASQQDLLSRLGRAQRLFVVIPSAQLARLHQAARKADVPYVIIDDRNSRYYLLSNQLGHGCDVDHNPLRRFVLERSPDPQKEIRVNFDNRVLLIGYDIPDTVTRGGSFPVTFYYKVIGQMPQGYKVFIHFDSSARRFHGDHEPLQGKYPTQYWLRGDILMDRHEVAIPMLTTPSGTYHIHAGFWRGADRLEIVEGPEASGNRVPLGTIVVK